MSPVKLSNLDFTRAVTVPHISLSCLLNFEGVRDSECEGLRTNERTMHKFYPYSLAPNITESMIRLPILSIRKSNSPSTGSTRSMPHLSWQSLLSLQVKFDGWKMDWESESTWEEVYCEIKDDAYQHGPLAIQTFLCRTREHAEEGWVILHRIREHVDQLCHEGEQEMRKEILELYDMLLVTTFKVKFFKCKLEQYQGCKL
ncbi:hypothetical protein EDC04DRAFT_2921958 [Pisolithus marmoratus]|nr:hypothetical protein EDC04DRAFT_2921958 [Pisolithus marmoratus]